MELELIITNEKRMSSIFLVEIRFFGVQLVEESREERYPFL